MVIYRLRISFLFYLLHILECFRCSDWSDKGQTRGGEGRNSCYSGIMQMYYIVMYLQAVYMNQKKDLRKVPLKEKDEA